MDELLSDVFTRDNAELLRRTTWRKAQNGCRYWSPLEINSTFHGRTRLDIAWKYGACYADGGFHSMYGRMGYDGLKKEWRQIPRDDSDSFPINTPVVLFDKLKVFSCPVFFENVSGAMLSMGAVNVQTEKSKPEAGKTSYSNQFMQEASRCDSKATIQRYRMPDEPYFKHVHDDHSEKVSVLNVNMIRGLPELSVNLRALAAWYHSLNRNARVEIHTMPYKINNNSITVDSIVSAVRNETTFVAKAKEHKLFTNKARFKARKYLAAGESKFDVASAVLCQCTFCTDRRKMFKKDTYHRVKRARRCPNAPRTEADEILGDLNKTHEIQVHGRSLNSSAIPGFTLIPIVCKLGGRLMSDNKISLVAYN